MPLALSHLVADRKAVVIPFGGAGDLRVEYYPRKVKGSTLAEYQAALDHMERARVAAKALAAGADPEQVDAPDGARATALIVGVTDLLLPLLASWDLTAEEGGPVLPIARETLDEMGVAVEWAILSAILTDGSGATAAGEAAAPGASASAPASGAGSSRRGSSAPSPTGTPS